MQISRDAMDGLHAAIDIKGQAITVGSRVRSFDFAEWDPATGEVRGCDLEGDAVCYVEGVVTAIGAEIMEGCPRYSIQVDTMGTSKTIGAAPVIEPIDCQVFPPLNGTLRLLSGRCLGVMAI